MEPSLRVEGGWDLASGWGEDGTHPEVGCGWDPVKVGDGDGTQPEGGVRDGTHH
jgi:hypothetical protein